MIVLGLSEGYHDAGACLIEDGEILSATHAERLSRKRMINGYIQNKNILKI